MTAAIGLGCAGCAMSFNARSLGVPASMSPAAGQAVVGDTFHVTTRALHLFWGAYPARVPNLQNALAGQLVGGAGVQNLSIRVRRRWSDVLVTVLSVGLFVPTSVTFDGVVTRGAP
ncbi:MAG: hypothetical protein AABY85_02770 [Gemmatimonadota bacterium]